MKETIFLIMGAVLIFVGVIVKVSEYDHKWETECAAKGGRRIMITRSDYICAKVEVVK